MMLMELVQQRDPGGNRQKTQQPLQLAMHDLFKPMLDLHQIRKNSEEDSQSRVTVKYAILKQQLCAGLAQWRMRGKSHFGYAAQDPRGIAGMTKNMKNITKNVYQCDYWLYYYLVCIVLYYSWLPLRVYFSAFWKKSHGRHLFLCRAGTYFTGVSSGYPKKSH